MGGECSHPRAARDPYPELLRGRGVSEELSLNLSHAWGGELGGEGSPLGRSCPRPDALGKVTGATDYPADKIRPGMLHLQVVFAGRPHARVEAIDMAAALAVSGVVAVLTGADVPCNAFGLVEADQPVLWRSATRSASRGTRWRSLPPSPLRRRREAHHWLT